MDRNGGLREFVSARGAALSRAAFLLTLFPLRHVDDHPDTVPAAWRARGGVILPMHQAEALWLSFDPVYPMAVKVAAGKINAVSGKEWSTTLHGPTNPPPELRARAAHHQDYLVLPGQTWLDGFNVATGQIRQFVAMPLGGGHTAEEQITGRAEVGGIQLLAYPLKAELSTEPRALYRSADAGMVTRSAAPPDMGLGLGGLMRQDIEADPHGTEGVGPGSPGAVLHPPGQRRAVAGHHRRTHADPADQPGRLRPARDPVVRLRRPRAQGPRLGHPRRAEDRRRGRGRRGPCLPDDGPSRSTGSADCPPDTGTRSARTPLSHSGYASRGLNNAGAPRSRPRRHRRGQQAVLEALSSFLEGRALLDGGCT